MRALWGLLLLSIAGCGLARHHRKAWQFVNERTLQHETPGKEVLCSGKKEGFYRHPRDCHLFVRCVDVFGSGRSFSAFQGRCEPGLVFDDNISACNWPELAAPCHGEGPGPEKLVIIGTSEEPKQAPLPKKTCLHKPGESHDEPLAQSLILKDDHLPVQQQHKQVAVDWWIPEDEQLNTGEGETILPETAILCQSEGFFREAENCSRFYRCEKESKDSPFSVHRFECPVKLVFDEEREACVHLRDIGMIEICTNTRSRSKRSPQGPPPRCEKEGFFRHPRDCRAFFRCVAGPGGSLRAHLFSCSSGLVFDEEASSCNWPHAAAPCSSTADDSRSPPFARRSSTRAPTTRAFTTRAYTTRAYTTRASTTRAYTTRPPPWGVRRQPQLGKEKNNDYNDKDGKLIPVRPQSTSRPPPAKPSPIAKCQRQGLFADPTDCRRFYQCVRNGNRFIRYELECPGITTFDGRGGRCSTNQNCRRPPPLRDEETATEPTDSGPSENNEGGGGDSDIVCSEEGYFRHPEDCNKFYRCVDFQGDGKSFVRYDFNCPEGLVFDETNSICNWPDQSPPCDGSGGSPGREESSSPGGQESSSSEAATEAETTQEEEITTSSSQTTSTTEQPREENGDSSSTEGEEAATQPSDSGANDGECTQEGFFRNPNDCNKFYRCVDFNGEGQSFVRYDFNCPEGLVFDEVNSVCNWPDQSPPCDGDNGGGGGGEQTTNGGGGGDEQTPGSSAQTTTSSSEREATESRSSSESSSTDTQTTSSTTTESSDQTAGSSSESSAAEGGQGECTEAGYFRNPEDCSQFYRCVDFKGDGQSYVRYDFSCPEGLVFDEVNSVCNWPDQSPPCEGGDGGGSSQTESSSESEEPTSGTRTTQPTTDAGSQQSSTPTSAPEQTSESTTTTERTKEQTTERTEDRTETSSDSSSSRSPSSGIECTEEGFFRHPDDCNKFYRCVDFKGSGESYVRYDFDCPEGLVFDEVNSVCNWPDQSPACDASGGGSSNGSEEQSTTTRASEEPSETDSTSAAQSPITTEATTASTTTQPTTTTAQSTTTAAQSTTTAGSTTASGDCVNEGFFKDSEDCTKFHRCVRDDEGMKRYDLECPEGLIFDENNEACDWPSDSNRCEGGGQSAAECTEEGFFADPEDCKKYYRCLESENGNGRFEKTDFSCNEDEVWNDEMKFCDRANPESPCEPFVPGETTTTSEVSSTTAEATSRPSEETESPSRETESPSGETEGPSSGTSAGSGKIECTEEGFFRHPEDCNKFYRCVDFKGDGQSYVRYDFDCPEGLVFDEVNSVCNWPTMTPACESSEPSEGDGKDDSSSTDNQSSSTESSSSSTESTPSQTQSSSSTTESSSTASSTTEDSVETASRSGEGSGSTREATPSESGSTRSSNSNIECTEEGFFRNPDDCNKFYRCVDFKGSGESYVRYDFDCPEGLVFDEVNSVCNWPNQSPACDTSGGGSSDQSEQQSSTAEEQFSTESTTTQSSSPSDSRGATSETASADCTEEGFFRDPEDCRRYYQCSRDENSEELRKTEFECPEGHVFDEQGRYCNADELSEQSCSDQGSGGAGEFRCEEEGFFRDPEDCGAYFQCTRKEEGGFESKRTECPEGHVFDEEGRYCNDEELNEDSCRNSSNSGGGSGGSSTTTSGDSGGGSSTECQEEGFFRDPDDCQKYYQCERSETGFDRSEHTCPDGHIFDEDARYCNAEELSEQPCSGGDNTSSSSTTTDSGTSDTSASESQNTSSSESRGKGECTEEGYFRNPEDCNKYYRCVDFKGDGQSYVRYDFDCPEGLIFDEVNSVCNWPNQSPPCESA